jgi:hypothetical protein
MFLGRGWDRWWNQRPPAKELLPFNHRCCRFLAFIISCVLFPATSHFLLHAENGEALVVYSERKEKKKGSVLHVVRRRISAAAALRQARAKLGRSRSAGEVAARTSRKPSVGVEQHKLKSKRQSCRTLGVSDGESEGELQDEQDERQDESEEEEAARQARAKLGRSRGAGEVASRTSRKLPVGVDQRKLKSKRQNCRTLGVSDGESEGELQDEQDESEDESEEEEAVPVHRGRRRRGTAQAQQRRAATDADKRQGHRGPSGAGADSPHHRQVLD